MEVTHFYSGFLQETTEDEDTKLNYSMLERMLCDDTAVYLYVGVGKAIIIPRRAFADAAQQQAFLAFIEGKLAQGKPAFRANAKSE